MSLKTPLVAVLIMVGSAALIFYFFQRQILGAALGFTGDPDVVSRLEASLEDQKRLALLDPGNEAVYRARFAEQEKALQRLRVLEHNRERLARRYELLLLAVFAASFIAVTGIYAVRQARHEPRLARLQSALEALADGRTAVSLDDRGRDPIGRIAAMIEQTSRLMARDRRRLAALENLSAWQEAARRHAHEMRTPLAAAQLELSRVRDLLPAAAGDAGRLEEAIDGAAEELSRLAEFTRHSTRFARLPRPRLEPRDLVALLREFVATFGSAWPGLTLELAASGSVTAAIDRDMLRQVLVNLCDNSHQAAAGGACKVKISVSPGSGTIQVDVADDGPGIADAVKPRLFEPYATTRGLGEGMGLGLAICRKILLDHHGDLELLASSPAGAVFRITLPLAGGEPA